MKNAIFEVASEEVQSVADLYHAAAQQLLLAYQRNKEATRHHTTGAFRAALHHARMSCVHAATANECLIQALEKSGKLSLPCLSNSDASTQLAAWQSH